MTLPPPDPDTKPDRALLERAVHDLKNPLSVVRATLEWLEVELVGREDALDAVRDATTASERIMTIVDDLDALARLGMDEVRAKERVEMSPLVANIVATANERLERRGISVASSMSAAELVTTGDERLLARSLAGLIDAATRGAPRGACIEVSLGESAGAVEVSVGLRGVPVDPDAQGVAPALETSGLGVYVAFRVLQAYGGDLWVFATSGLPRMVASLPRVL